LDNFLAHIDSPEGVNAEYETRGNTTLGIVEILGKEKKS